MKELLRIDHLCKDTILNGIHFAVEQGEMTAIMGPSGSGKSTLLYQISGMDQATEGEVWLGEKELVHMSEDEKARLRLHEMGFVFQQMNMVSNLNLLDNILLPAYQAQKHVGKGELRRTKSAMKQEATELMRKFDIAGLEERRITEVSGGQLQRACICRSMINHPKLLLADEPTGALNQSAAGSVMEAFLKLNREGTTVLMVTHDSRVASRCDRILYLLDGEIRGELQLGKQKDEEEKEREVLVNEWLSKMGW